MSLVATFLAVAVAALPTGGTHQPSVVVHERFGVSPEDAITYDRSAVPKGSRAVVAQWSNRDGTTTIDLGVKDLEPNRTYGAHIHTEPCGAKPEDAGPHYQNRVDPVQPSVDPAYANRKNEVWLDFTTDAGGDAASRSTVDWRFRTGQARSVIIHEHATMTHPGHAGTAGARLACITVPFD
ncbi:superoxide dismutase family protein [Streptomyces sp. CRN 30]|uniref:superoxide dismutase family protein n=1 Tax=Streptomyces sp. CRN 30 TaxID=3075613 RepID=UPI002A827373|nr:superoxide dismutase family protein [Streptomyces sp. CRN 30]